jgi:hypothetical protein
VEQLRGILRHADSPVIMLVEAVEAEEGVARF